MRKRDWTNVYSGIKGKASRGAYHFELRCLGRRGGGHAGSEVHEAMQTACVIRQRVPSDGAPALAGDNLFDGEGLCLIYMRRTFRK